MARFELAIFPISIGTQYNQLRYIPNLKSVYKVYGITLPNQIHHELFAVAKVQVSYYFSQIF